MDPATYELLRNKTLLFFIEKLLDPAHGVGSGSNNSSSSTTTTTATTTTGTGNTNNSSSCNSNNNNNLVLYTNKRTLHDLSCQFGSKGFTKEMRQIAGGSQSGLKKFLQSYPSIFRIDGDMVSYNVNSSTLINSSSGGDNNNPDGSLDDNNTDSNSPSHHHSNNNNQQQLSSIDSEAVEYFRERLMQYGIGIWVPVKSLLGHRSQAPPHIRHVSGQHIREFTTFLSKYPATFIINAQDEVLLKEFENYYNNENNRLSQDSTTSTPTHSKLLIEKKRIVELIEFYANCLVERGPMLVEQLFCAGNMKYDNSNYGDDDDPQKSSEELLWDYFKTPNDLSTFFKMYPQCFVVHSNLVTFSDTYKVGLEYLKRQMGVGGSGIIVPQPRVVGPPVGMGTQSPVKQVMQQPQLQQQKQKPVEEKPSSPKAATAATKPEKPQSLLKSRVSKILMQTINQNTAHDYKHDVLVTSPTRPSSQQQSNNNKKDSSSPLHHHHSNNSHVSQFTALCSSTTPDSDELRAYILSRTTIVSNQRKAGQIIDEIMKAGEPVSLDFEGINLGNDGQITLVQVGTGRGSVFIFDVLTQPGLIEGGERSLLGGLLCGGGGGGSEGDGEEGCGGGVVKVMHDCRNDSVNLYRQFGIRLRNVFDTQVAHIVIQQTGDDGNNGEEVEEGGGSNNKSSSNSRRKTDDNDSKGGDDEERQRGSGGNSKNISLNNLCSVYGTVCNPFKDKVKSVYRHDQKYWSRRPLTKQMIAYASCDVMCLVPSIHLTLKSKIESDPARLKLFQELCEEQILTHIEPDEIRSRRRLRKNEADLRGLRGKLDRAFSTGGGMATSSSNSSLVLSNREMRLLKHLNLTEDEKERLKLSLKVAKKLEKMSSSSGAASSPRQTQTEGDNSSLTYNNYFQQTQHQSITTTLSSAESTSNSELTSLEYGGGGGESNNNNNNSLTTVTVPFHPHQDPRIAQIDSLEAIINRLISDSSVVAVGNNSEDGEQRRDSVNDEYYEDEQQLLEEEDNHQRQQRNHHPLDFVLGSGGGSDGKKKSSSSSSLQDSATQTISTGDIVITKVFDD